VPSSSETRNVGAELKDPNSILNFYKKLIQLRRNQPALQNGTYQALNQNDEHVLSWLRKNKNGGDSVIVVVNMSNAPHKVAFDLKPFGIQQNYAQSLLSNSADHVQLNDIQMPPFAVFIASLR